MKTIRKILEELINGWRLEDSAIKREKLISQAETEIKKNYIHKDRLSVEKLAFIIKDSKLPFLECITKERRNEACFDLATELSKELKK